MNLRLSYNKFDVLIKKPISDVHMLRIRVDFNSMSQGGDKVLINVIVQPELLDQMYPGLRVILYEPHDIQVEATIELECRSDGIQFWWGVADWSTLQDL